ncbi:hypothetical protein EVAR_46310_1 [Eumeta japonica]|uniref:Uncharacterized protein n=1 Tax=Eumeta variegata TaxID=151549 RepID=A0A4C1Y0U0_EUMVA|nr:hypothetical protein EVAR_46310_1 [Eumeta japonica]
MALSAHRQDIPPWYFFISDRGAQNSNTAGESSQVLSSERWECSGATALRAIRAPGRILHSNLASDVAHNSDADSDSIGSVGLDPG